MYRIYCSSEHCKKNKTFTAKYKWLKRKEKSPHTSKVRISARSTATRLGTTMNNMKNNDNKVNSNKTRNNNELQHEEE